MKLFFLLFLCSYSQVFYCTILLKSDLFLSVDSCLIVDLCGGMEAGVSYLTILVISLQIFLNTVTVDKEFSGQAFIIKWFIIFSRAALSSRIFHKGKSASHIHLLSI